jgi:hypothetical protein
MNELVPQPQRWTGRWWLYLNQLCSEAELSQRFALANGAWYELAPVEAQPLPDRQKQRKKRRKGVRHEN